MLAVQHVLDDGELCADGGRVGGCAVALECRNHLECFLVFALTDEKTGRVRKEGAGGVDAEGENCGSQDEAVSIEGGNIQIWKASGKRHTTSLGANEKPKVSQLEIEKPVMQLA